ncbi:2-oxo acid dehydrogenase subunit E2 [Halorientalis sp.]|uniref:2-oxo acid dehydrogenase subunit E2 n=1 Tax=Halorientalis sp. TaxID=1931229 RepID=UPI002601E089|nr:2-oxo acid dehydrogenase subunit E2 [Halorientalis sp.]
MVHAVRMPMMGNTMETGLLVGWRVDEGDEITDGTVLAEVESEKASTDIEASQDGSLARVDVEEGEEVPPGTVLGVVLGPDESLEDAPEPRSRVDTEADAEAGAGDSGGAETEPATEPATGGGENTTSASEAGGEKPRAAPGARELADEHGVDLDAVEGTGPEGAILRADVSDHLGGVDDDEGGATSTQGFTSPSTRRLARELGVTIGEIDGSGIGGRVTESDVRAAAGAVKPVSRNGVRPTAGETSDTTASTDMTDPARLGVTVTEERPLSGMRRTIADRMARSAKQAPHVTLNRDVTVERAFETAEELGNEAGAAVGFTDLLVGAAVRALDASPEFNAWFEDETVRHVAERNVAVAVDTENGLVTPVIRSADDRTLRDIAAERQRLTDAVLDGTHGMDDLQGGTFTITNLGMFGVDSFDPIINPPQVAILGVGRVRERDGTRTCTLSLSFDHRVVDGADAARFLETLTEGVEAPSLVVADRSAGQSDREREEPAAEAGGETIAAAVRRDVEARANEIAATHGWPVPEFDVRINGGRPEVTLDAAENASPAAMKRLAYAACRESTYADTITDLRDPEIEVLSA